MLWGQMSIWGHLGSQGSKHCFCTKQCSKCFSYGLRSMVTWLMHMNQHNPLPKSYGPKKSLGVNRGHRGQNIVFTQNVLTPPIYSVYSYNLCKFCSLGPSTIVLGSEFNLGSRGVTEAQIMILHNAHNFYPSFF